MSNSVDPLVLHHNKLMQNDLPSVDIFLDVCVIIYLLFTCMYSCLEKILKVK